MITAHAPLELPFAPRPFRGEMFSSWLLRLAAANCVSLDELLLGFQSSYPSAPCPVSLDLNLDRDFLRAMARFSRVPVITLGHLSLENQVPDPESTLLLWLTNNSAHSSRQLSRRLAYAFCHSCIAQQNSVHVRWEWTVACLLHCSVHKIPLSIGCPSCGDLDPLRFGIVPVPDHVSCQSCDANLLGHPNRSAHRPSSPRVIALEKAYRLALLGIAPDLAPLDGASGAQFRLFVDDTLRLLVNHQRSQWSARCGNHQPIPLSSRHEMIGTISQLILNACPDCDMYERRARYRKSLKLWNSLLAPLTSDSLRSLARASRAWPSVLQRPFASAFGKLRTDPGRIRDTHQSTLSGI
jgi:hypothetical protein